MRDYKVSYWFRVWDDDVKRIEDLISGFEKANPDRDDLFQETIFSCLHGDEIRDYRDTRNPHSHYFVVDIVECFLKHVIRRIKTHTDGRYTMDDFFFEVHMDFFWFVYREDKSHTFYDLITLGKGIKIDCSKSISDIITDIENKSTKSIPLKKE